MINPPAVDANSYMVEDSVDAAPKHGTTVQAGWGAADAYLKPKNKEGGGYANNFKFSEQPQLVRFLDDAPFHIYEEHWIERDGKKSFVCLEGECPLCTVAGDKARARFAFNVIVVSDEEQSVQIMTVPPTFARILRAKAEDPRLGPLTKHYWAISRIGIGRDTQYSIDRVRATDLADEWELDADEIDATVSKAVKYDKSVVYVSPRDELLDIARTLVS